MSHFSVVVITKSRPNEQKLDRIMRPWHEYECTGFEDQYVQNIDVTDEARKEYTESLETFEEFAKYWYGEGAWQDGRVIQRTNPNAKWDWYVVGGRFTGYWLAKPTTEVGLGESGGVDVIQKKNIDAEGMMGNAGEEAMMKWNMVMAWMGDRRLKMTWEEYVKRVEADELKIDEARELYHSDPLVEAWKVWPQRNKLSWTASPDDFYMFTLQEYVDAARASALSPYAFIRDCMWSERGEMGWWGMASNEMEQSEWSKKFLEMFEALPADMWLTMVDCHI